MPTSIVQSFFWFFFSLYRDISHFRREKSFFSRHMIPTVGPLQKHGEEHPPPPPPSDPTTSPATTYRPESTRFVQSLPHNPFDHPPPMAPLRPRHSRRETSIKITLVDAGHQPPTPPSTFFIHPPQRSYRTPSWYRSSKVARRVAGRLSIISGWNKEGQDKGPPNHGPTFVPGSERRLAPVP